MKTVVWIGLRIARSDMQAPCAMGRKCRPQTLGNSLDVQAPAEDVDFGFGAVFPIPIGGNSQETFRDLDYITSMHIN
jgi:hypothetical protein